MAYTIMRFKKDKGGAVASCERHNERKKEMGNVDGNRAAAGSRLIVNDGIEEDSSDCYDAEGR